MLKAYKYRIYPNKQQEEQIQKTFGCCRYVKIGRFTKSSQPCNVCGYINPDTKDLSIREWTCTQCGTVHDRDVNAAKNILNEGLRILRESA